MRYGRGDWWNTNKNTTAFLNSYWLYFYDMGLVNQKENWDANAIVSNINSCYCIYFIEQKLKYIPPSALSEVVMYLNNYSPLGNNWKAIADEMLITFEAIRSLDHHGPDGMMSGVLDIMFHRKVTVGLFVQMLQRIQRPDVIDILVKAGLQGDFFQEYESGMTKTSSILFSSRSSR